MLSGHAVLCMLYVLDGSCKMLPSFAVMTACLWAKVKSVSQSPAAAGHRRLHIAVIQLLYETLLRFKGREVAAAQQCSVQVMPCWLVGSLTGEA
jgi:hypothetical protein